MARLTWHKPGERKYETGVDRGVLYIPNDLGVYAKGVAWNGLVSVSESPSGAEPSPQYADNIKYLNLLSAEEFGASIEAFTYPVEFEQCDGTAEVAEGLYIGQQPRRSFGLAYRSLIGNELKGTDFGYKIHLIYGALAAPTEKARTTVNESPEAMTLSWEISTTPVEVPDHKPTAHFIIDSTKSTPEQMAAIEKILYGDAEVEPRLPTPAEIITIFAGATSEVVIIPDDGE